LCRVDDGDAERHEWNQPMLGQLLLLPRPRQPAVHSVHQRTLRHLGRHVLLVPGVGRTAGTAAVAMAAALAAVSAGSGTVPVELVLGGARALG